MRAERREADHRQRVTVLLHGRVERALAAIPRRRDALAPHDVDGQRRGLAQQARVLASL